MMDGWVVGSEEILYFERCKHMVWNFAMLPPIVKKLLKVAKLALFGLLCVVLVYIIASAIFHATYTSFCNVRGSNERRVSQTMDITDNTYRLGGIGNIGVGSTRQEVVDAVERRNALIRIFHHDIPPSRYNFFSEPHSLSGSTLGFYRVRTWNAIEFLFDENDRVVKIRVTPMF